MNRRAFIFGGVAAGGVVGLRTLAQTAPSVSVGEAELKTDVLICGGGPAGVAAALAAKKGVQPRQLDAKAVQALLG